MIVFTVFTFYHCILGDVLSVGAFLLFLHPWCRVSRNAHTLPPSPPSISPSPSLQLGQYADGHCGGTSLLLPGHEVPSGIWWEKHSLHTSDTVSSYLLIKDFRDGKAVEFYSWDMVLQSLCIPSGRVGSQPLIANR